MGETHHPGRLVVHRWAGTIHPTGWCEGAVGWVLNPPRQAAAQELVGRNPALRSLKTRDKGKFAANLASHYGVLIR